MMTSDPSFLRRREFCESADHILRKPFPGEGRGPVGEDVLMLTSVSQLGPGLRRGTRRGLSQRFRLRGNDEAVRQEP